jgi:uncharacterized protein YggE
MPDDLSDEAAPSDTDPTRAKRPTGRTVVTVAAVGALLIGSAALGLAVTNNGGTASAAPSCGTGHSKVTVVGTGKQTAVPDVLNAVMTVNATAASAAAALSQDGDKVTAAVTALTQSSTARRDIQTTGLTLQPQYAYPKGVPTVTGYQVTSTLTATLRHTATAGTAIDAVVGAAGNAVDITSLTFSFDHPGVVEDSARASAVRQAVSHARAMAQAAGRHLGPLCSLTDTTPSSEVPQPTLNQSFAAAGADAAAAVPLEPGTQSESDQVTLVFTLGEPS